MTNMTVEQRWSSLFHNTLQAGECVTPALAEEALALIRWASEKYRMYCAEQGYRVSPDLKGEYDCLCNALHGKVKGHDAAPADWPIDVLNRWEMQKPFHEALVPELSGSCWNSIHKQWKKQQAYSGEGADQ